MKKYIAILLTAVLLFSLTGCGEKPQPVPELLYPTETANAVSIVSRKILTSVQCTGGSVVPEVVDLKFSYDTSASNVAVELGDHVTEGQLLMELNPELEDSIKRLELSIVREQTEYEYEVEQFNKQIKQMRDYAKALSGYDSKMVKLQMQEMQLNFDRSHSEQAKKLDEDRETLAEMKQELADSKVYAPCSGTVVYINVYEDGDEIREDKTFLAIAKDNTKRLACNFVSRADYETFADVKAYIGDDVYDVTYIPYTDEEVYELEKTGNKYDSYFTADLKDSVQLGDYVQFVFTKATAEPVMTVPTAAVGKTGKSNYVMLVRDGYMEQREVEIGEAGINDTEIVSGLSEGDVVYVAKNLTRYGVQYETLKPQRVTYTETVKVTGAKKIARVTEPYENPVPGEITEIHVNGFIDIVVKKGDPIFTVKAEIGRADQEQAKLDLRQYTDRYEESRDALEDRIDELTKSMKKMKSSSLEYSLAELDLADLKEELARMDEEAEEQIAKLNERITNFEEWEGQTVVIRAEKDCVINDLSKFKVGYKMAEGEYLFEMYDLDSYCICLEQPPEDVRLRYGQKLTMTSTVAGEESVYEGYIVSSPNVRPNDASDKNMVYVALNNPDEYGKFGSTGLIEIEEYNVVNSMVIDDKLVFHDPKPASSTQQQNRGGQQGGGNFGNYGDWGDWGGWGGQQEIVDYSEAESFTFDSEAHEEKKGKAYVWVYDENGCAVKRYIRVMRAADDRYWVVDGLNDNDIILVH